MMFKDKLLKIFCIITGIVFLVSGFGKIPDVTGFAYLISSYGLRWASGLAPAIVVVEIAVGMLLVLGIQLRRVSLFAVFMLAAFTVAYGYGYWVHDVEDCGCFGVANRVTTPFWVVFLRNAFLMYFMFETYKRTAFERISVKWKPALVHSIIIAAAFAAGLTYYPFAEPYTETGYGIGDSPVSDIPEPLDVLLSPDSSYLVFVFSYGCPHCWNSIENLKQYAGLPEIDRVVGITPADTAGSVLFRQQFNPRFAIHAMPPEDMGKFPVTGYPTAFYIKNNIIRHVIEGELPCSYFFQKDIGNNQNQE